MKNLNRTALGERGRERERKRRKRKG